MKRTQYLFGILLLALLLVSTAAANADSVPPVTGPAAPQTTVKSVNFYQACNVDTYNEGPQGATTNITRFDYDRVDSNPSPANNPDSAHPIALDYRWFSSTGGVTDSGWLRETDGSAVWQPTFDCNDPVNGCAPITVKLWVNNDNGTTPLYDCTEICTKIDADGACNDPRGEWRNQNGGTNPVVCEFSQVWSYTAGTDTWAPASTQDIGIVTPCAGVPAPACTTSQIFGYVYNDANNNGVRDGGETGIAGAKVRVRSIYTGFDQTTTIPTGSSNGYWLLSTVDVPASGGAPYIVEVTYPPATPAWVPTTPTSVTVNLTCAGSKQTAHGATASAALGDFVWLDANANGVQDAGETGVAGVTVALVDATGAQLSDVNGVPYQMTTDTNGAYLFPALRPGAYAVMFTPPAGYNRTTANTGADDARDSDPDPTTGRTATVTLTAGSSNLTLDAGLVLIPMAVTLRDFRGTPASDVGVLRITLYGALGAVGALALVGGFARLRRRPVRDC